MTPESGIGHVLATHAGDDMGNVPRIPAGKETPTDASGPGNPAPPAPPARGGPSGARGPGVPSGAGGPGPPAGADGRQRPLEPRPARLARAGATCRGRAGH